MSFMGEVTEGMAGNVTPSKAGLKPSVVTAIFFPISTPTKNKSTHKASKQIAAIVIIRAVKDKVYCIAFGFL
jgi:hypothetical protein